MQKIKVVVKEPFKTAQVKEIKPELSVFQGLVDGYIDAVTPDEYCYGHNISAYINDDGKIYHLYPNLRLWGDKDYIAGTCVFTKADENGNDISMSEEEIQHILQLCRETEYHLDEFI